ncbi:hypothetical protein GZH46_00067 [Fragariocoptes setiger]|uniref:Uncharacterized protein n=1 Tax=Fragariocoptes setiger TaxID=1670756 RepID=A0ABQ7SD86_9ACAR|nr:hypothetical protein GZH46_00067 [Fragariocoptes setiger]
MRSLLLLSIVAITWYCTLTLDIAECDSNVRSDNANNSDSNSLKKKHNQSMNGNNDSNSNNYYNVRNFNQVREYARGRYQSLFGRPGHKINEEYVEKNVPSMKTVHFSKIMDSLLANELLNKQDLGSWQPEPLPDETEFDHNSPSVNSIHSMSPIDMARRLPDIIPTLYRNEQLVSPQLIDRDRFIRNKRSLTFWRKISHFLRKSDTKEDDDLSSLSMSSLSTTSTTTPDSLLEPNDIDDDKQQRPQGGKQVVQRSTRMLGATQALSHIMSTRNHTSNIEVSTSINNNTHVRDRQVARCWLNAISCFGSRPQSEQQSVSHRK